MHISLLLAIFMSNSRYGVKPSVLALSADKQINMILLLLCLLKEYQYLYSFHISYFTVVKHQLEITTIKCVASSFPCG